MVPVGGGGQQAPHLSGVSRVILDTFTARVTQERTEHTRMHVNSQLYLSGEQIKKIRRRFDLYDEQ